MKIVDATKNVNMTKTVIKRPTKTGTCKAHAMPACGKRLTDVKVQNEIDCRIKDLAFLVEQSLKVGMPHACYRVPAGRLPGLT
jgi:hypothetical protein